MLKTRIIPCLDVKDGRVVKGVNFTELRDAGDPVEQAKLYDAQGADELCFLDISASHEGRATTLNMVSRVAEACFMPLTVGGGIRAVEDVRTLLLAGADKVSIGTAAVTHPDLVRAASEKFGAQCIVVSIDAKTIVDGVEGRGARGEEGGKRKREDFALVPRPSPLDPRFQVFTHGGRHTTGIDAVEWAMRMEALGAGELLVNSMDRDGTKQGFNVALTRAIADAVSIPVIASGGVGQLSHFVEGVKEGHASAVLAASVFHYGTFTIAEVKSCMQAAGIAVRT